MSERLHGKRDLTLADAVEVVLTRRDTPALSGFLTRRDVERAAGVLADYAVATAYDPGLIPPDVEQAIDASLALVRAEMLRTVAKRGAVGATLHSSHEGLGVLVEELFKELVDAVHANDPAAQVREAIQVAAVAARWPIDLGAIRHRDAVKRPTVAEMRDMGRL